MRQVRARRTGSAGSRSEVFIDIETLSDSDCRHLAAAVSSRPLDQGAMQQVVTHSAGNPFLIHEIVRWFNGAGADTPLDRFSVERAVLSRLGTLDQHSRRLVELVAVAGQPTQLEVFRGVPEVGNLIAARDELLSARFVRSRLVQDREELEIYHDRIRDALASTIDPESRVVRHRELAHALEATGGDAERMAVHCARRIPEPEPCSRYALEAAHRALGVMAFNKAAQLLQLALATGALQADTRRVVQRQLGDALANANAALKPPSTIPFDRFVPVLAISSTSSSALPRSCYSAGMLTRASRSLNSFSPRWGCAFRPGLAGCPFRWWCGECS